MLASVVYVARWDPRLSALDHVHHRINDFLDASGSVSLPNAATKGNTSLFQHVLTRVVETSDIDPLLRYHWLGKAMENAIKGGYLDIVKLIHAAHPSPLAIRAFKIAAEAGQLKILQWLHDNRFDGLCIDVPPSQKDPRSMRCCLEPPLERYVCSFGRVCVLRWLYETGYADVITPGAGDVAAAHGDLEMVQWLDGEELPHMFTSKGIDAAVTHGHVTILEFLYERGHQHVSEQGMIQAMARGHTDVVEYLKKQVIWTIVESEALAMAAAEHGRVDLLEQCERYVKEPAIRAKLLKAAVSNGHLQVAQWLGNGHVDAATLHWAASRGHVDVLQWVHEQDCGEWATWVVAGAAMSAQVEVVKWFHQHKPTLFADSDVLRAAAQSGDLSLVKWIHAHGHHACSGAMRDAVANGRVELATWLHTNCNEPALPSSRERADLANAANSGRLEMLMWLHDQGCHGLARGDTLTAPPDVQMWLHDVLGFPITEELVTRAASRDGLAFVQWLYARSDLRVDRCRHPHLRHWMHLHRQDDDA